MENKYTILSNYAAPERDISTHTFEKFVDISWLDESSLKDWFADYRYDAEVEQGESYYNQSIEKEIEYPDGSTHKIDIPVVLSYCDTHSFDEEVECELKKLKDGEILIKAEMEWTGGNWNSFSIELDESEKFEPKKIEARGYLGMVVGYDYNGTSFENNEDWSLRDGYINLNVYLKFDNQVHELDLNDISKKLEKNNIEIDSSNSEEILSFLKNDILSNKQEEIQEQDIEEALNLYPDDMKMAAKSLNMDFKIFKEKVYSNILLKDKWVPELKNESEIIDLKKVNEIKKICEECLKNKISFTDWRDQFIEKDYNIDPYDSNKCIFKINFKKFNFYLGLMYRAEDKVDFIVDKYAGWS